VVMGPAVTGILAGSLLRLAPHALPDAFAGGMFVATVTALRIRWVGTFELMIAGSLLGRTDPVLSYLSGLPRSLAVRTVRLSSSL
jgi:hypothetical protein